MGCGTRISLGIEVASVACEMWCKRRVNIIEAMSCSSSPQSANLASTTLVPLASKLRSTLSGLMSCTHQNSAEFYLVGQSRIMLPVWAIPFACRDPNADRTLRAISLMSCLEILASSDDFSASTSRCSNTRKGGSLPWSMKFLIHGSPSNCCKIPFSRFRRISGAHLSTTRLCAVVLELCSAGTDY